MRQAIKRPLPVRAFALGKGSMLEKLMICEGKLIRTAEGHYLVFSQETRGAAGEFAATGDYVKIDSAGSPYPNAKAWFEENHRLVGEDTYLPISKPVQVWFLGDPQNEILRYLQEEKGLVIDETSANACFTAPLWGTVLTAKKDAALVIYRVSYADDGNISDADFNFVAADEFAKTYDLI